jgi:hypothetical protein
MNKLMLILFISISSLTFSQNYGQIKYMNRTIQINTSFFERLHSKYETKMQYGEINYKYQKIYYDLVDLLKSQTTTVIVDEAKRISWLGINGNFSSKYTKSRDKKRPSYLLYQILLPVIESSY